MLLYPETVIVVSVSDPANIYLFKVDNRNTRKKCEICSKLTIKTPGDFIVNFEYISQLFHNVSVNDFELVNVCWNNYKF